MKVTLADWPLQMAVVPVTTDVGLGLTVTVKLQVLLLLWISVIVQVTVVAPTGNTYPFSVEPPFRLLTTDRIPQLSFTDTGLNSVPPAV